MGHGIPTGEVAGFPEVSWCSLPGLWELLDLRCLFPAWSLPLLSCIQWLHAERTDSSEALVSERASYYYIMMVPTTTTTTNNNNNNNNNNNDNNNNNTNNDSNDNNDDDNTTNNNDNDNDNTTTNNNVT